MEASYHLLQNTNSKENTIINDTDNNVGLVDNIKRKLIIDTCNGIQDNTNILNLHVKHDNLDNENIKSLYTSTSNSLGNIKKTINRTIPTNPERILDAPEFRDDYYLNLMDWSSSNLLAVALNKEMYLWNASSGDISLLFSMDENTSDYITSTAWIQNKGILVNFKQKSIFKLSINLKKGNILAVGNSKSIVELWDVEKQMCVRKMKSHVTRIGSLSWNQHILTSGSRSGIYLYIDR